MMVKNDIKNKFQILHFQSQGVHFCIDLEFVKKFLPLVELEPIPGAANFVAGLMDVAGRGVPVIDFGICLGLNRTRAYSLDTPILVCTDQKDEMGIIIDSVIGLDFVEKDSFQMQEKFSKSNSPFLAAIVLDHHLTLLVDMSEILKINLMNNTTNFILENELVNKMRIEL